MFRSTLLALAACFALSAAFLAATIIYGLIESIENFRQLIDDVIHVDGFFVQLVIAVVAKPQEAVELVLEPFAFYDEAHGILKPSR